MNSLRLQKTSRFEPLQKAPLLLRIFVTAVAILIVFTLLEAIERQADPIDEPCAQDAGWDLNRMWH